MTVLKLFWILCLVLSFGFAQEGAVQSAVETLETEPFVMGLRLEGNPTNTYDEALWNGTSNALRDLARDDIDVVLYGQTSPLSFNVGLLLAAGSSSETGIRLASSQFPDTRFVLLDSEVRALNVQSVTFEEHEVSFLLGYLAGVLSQTGTLGFIGDTETPTTLANQAAFIQGVLAACNACTIQSAFVGSTNDVATAKALAAAIQQKGADILFAAAGDSSQGVIDFVNETMCFTFNETRPSPLTAALVNIAKSISYLSSCSSAQPLFFMGIGPYQPVLGDSDDDPTTLNHGLTSILKQIDRAAYQAILDFANGTFQAGTQQLGLKDEAVEMAIDDYNRALLPVEVLAQLETLEAQIISGELVVTTTLPAAEP